MSTGDLAALVRTRLTTSIDLGVWCDSCHWNHCPGCNCQCCCGTSLAQQVPYPHLLSYRRRGWWRGSPAGIRTFLRIGAATSRFDCAAFPRLSSPGILPHVSRLCCWFCCFLRTQKYLVIACLASLSQRQEGGIHYLPDRLWDWLSSFSPIQEYAGASPSCLACHLRGSWATQSRLESSQCPPTRLGFPCYPNSSPLTSNQAGGSPTDS